MDYSEYSNIKIDRHDDGVLLATLNRPNRLNALDEQLLGEINRLWLQLADDANVRVVIVTGAGRAFSVGADIDLVGKFNENVDGPSTRAFSTRRHCGG